MLKSGQNAMEIGNQRENPCCDLLWDSLFLVIKFTHLFLWTLPVARPSQGSTRIRDINNGETKLYSSCLIHIRETQQ